MFDLGPIVLSSNQILAIEKLGNMYEPESCLEICRHFWMKSDWVVGGTFKTENFSRISSRILRSAPVYSKCSKYRNGSNTLNGSSYTTPNHEYQMDSIPGKVQLDFLSGGAITLPSDENVKQSLASPSWKIKEFRVLTFLNNTAKLDKI